jgi:UDP-3-O-[3-hydroxymyristoyl] glucosamine N-acyltransferase
VIGYEGFGYYQADGVHHRIEHIGNVVIEDDVDLGACTCVDRAKFGSTRVGRGSKIDNLVQIAHNARIGEGCILVGQSAVAGSARLGRYVVLGGTSGIRDNVSIGDGTQVASRSSVANDVDAGQVVGGTPARPMAEMRRVFPAMMKLPDLLKRVKALEKKMDELG